jgi:hypothetical protein
MKIYNENDVIRLKEPITADVVGERRSLVISSGTAGTVVLVHGDPNQPAAYEIEFYIEEEDCYALATLEAKLI